MARKSFHHGDLRRAIIDAAIRLIAEKGVRGFTLSDASREAGVAKSAPYRHFASKEAILVAVASESFDRFEAELLLAGGGSDPAGGAIDARAGAGDARAWLRAMLLAYLHTALRRPAEFQAMFASGIDKGEHRELAVKAERCFELLRAAVVRCQAVARPASAAHGLAAGSSAARSDLQVTFQLWIGVHGVSVLAIDGSLRKLGGEKRIVGLIDELIASQLS